MSSRKLTKFKFVSQLETAINNITTDLNEPVSCEKFTENLAIVNNLLNTYQDIFEARTRCISSEFTLPDINKEIKDLNYYIQQTLSNQNIDSLTAHLLYDEALTYVMSSLYVLKNLVAEEANNEFMGVKHEFNKAKDEFESIKKEAIKEANNDVTNTYFVGFFFNAATKDSDSNSVIKDSNQHVQDFKESTSSNVFTDNLPSQDRKTLEQKVLFSTNTFTKNPSSQNVELVIPGAAFNSSTNENIANEEHSTPSPLDELCFLSVSFSNVTDNANYSG